MDIMQHLFDLGHQRIGFITGMMNLASGQERLRGYVDALEETGLFYDYELVVEVIYRSSLFFEGP